MEIPNTSNAFIESLTQHQLAIKAYVRSSIGHYLDSDDVIQKTNIVLWKKAEQWDPNTPFLPWALRVAHYEILAFYRDRSRSKLLFDEDVLEMLTYESSTHAESTSERVLALRSCLTSLKKDHQQILSARYAFNHSIAEIANGASRSEDSIKSLLLRVRKQLNRCITKKLKHSPLP
ncbi:sigma-70 family RNA polymerase sigma factor [Rubritalea tangerina]|uniref:Sigma-70 family RNA polymerase sigma factor n=1 Tax=Rubritalea tangerina TaxID=430798 RepID=A0ABW4Z882_9BACT